MKESKLRKLKDAAADAVSKGKYKKALKIYKDVLDDDPHKVEIMLKVGDLSRKVGLISEALQVYCAAVEHYAADGMLLRGVAVCKIILEIDPQHKEAQARLADMYASKFGTEKEVSKDPSAPPQTLPSVPPAEITVDLSGFDEEAVEMDADERVPDGERETAEPEEDEVETGAEDDDAEDDDIFELVDEEGDGGETDLVISLAPAPIADNLPEIPLFSDLDRHSFVALLERSKIRKYGPRETIIEEGEAGESFFILLEGRVIVKKGETTLAALAEGAFFGEMAVISPGPRQASVKSLNECTLLEISQPILTKLEEDFPHVGEILEEFTEKRLLQNLLITSELFAPFSADDRRALVGRFEPRTLEADQVVIAQGGSADGLYLIVSGGVEVRYANATGTDVEISQLGPNEIFGEISLLTRAAATATVRTTGITRVLCLPKAIFTETIMTHPQILELISTLSQDRKEQLDAVVKRALASEIDSGCALL